MNEDRFNACCDGCYDGKKCEKEDSRDRGYGTSIDIPNSTRNKYVHIDSVCINKNASWEEVIRTPQKTLTPQEALRALAEGKKLTCKGYESYIWLDRGVIVWSGGHTYKGDFNEVIEYTEPKPKRKVAPYYVEHSNGRIALEDSCFETDEQAKKYHDGNPVTRCTVLEIEV